MQITIVIMLISGVGFSQQRTVSYNLPELLTSGKLSTTNREASVLSAGEKAGIKLSSAAGEGAVWLNGIKFTNGVIELDVKGKNVEQQSFVGIAFHGMEDTKTFDVIYLRPFNFKADDLVKKKPPGRLTSNEELNELINLRWLFFLIVILISVEWGLRKYHGAY